MLTGQPDDLDQSILRHTEAIFLTPPRVCWLQHIVEIFNSLAFAIFVRAKRFGQPEDVKCCIMFLRYMHEQWNGVPIHVHFSVTETLIRSLAVQVKLGLGEDQEIEEMAELCDELFSTDATTEPLTDPIEAFASAVNARLGGHLGVPVPSENVIGCLRKATLLEPHLHIVSIALADSLFVRFHITSSDDNYREGIVVVDKIIRFRYPGGRPSLYLGEALHLAIKFDVHQFGVGGKPEQLEKAIYRIGAYLESSSHGESYRPVWSRFRLLLKRWRSRDDRITADAEYALSMTSEFAKLPSFRDLTTSLHESSLDKLPNTTFSKHVNALNPMNIGGLTDLEGIEDAVEYCQQLLASHPSSKVAPLALKALPNLFHHAFDLTNEIKYLDEAISAARDHVNITPDPYVRHDLRLRLISCLSIRLDLSNRRQDLNELMYAYAIEAKDENVPALDKYALSCQWASSARLFGHSFISVAYNRAMSSMEALLTFSPTLDTQHSQLAGVGEDVITLPLDYASYQIRIGRLDRAIETLERGRALLWSEMRGLRTSIDQLRLADPRLADKFAAINRQIEYLTFGFPPTTNVDGRASDTEGMDPFGRLVVQQQRLLDDRKKLISQIQALPGFNTFFKPPSLNTLCSAACNGPVIIINHCKWSSDIIILLHDSPPSLIPMSDDFYARARKLQERLLEERKEGIESDKYEEALRYVLKELYELVGRPVIEKLNELNIPEQSRVWWCPTSVFCSLPLHAMGPIPSDVGPPRYFLDLYIPSYIPSLSALIESRKSSLQTFGKPSILLVSQPDEKMPQALKEMKAVQAIDTQVTTLFSAKATPTAVLERLRDHPFAHIVCHGILEPGKPFEASFKLHGGKRLQLLDIVRSQLPDAEFAFLSACHTAELTDESIADEVLHLAAAMQFCGFRSVVGTMWAMADVDGRDLARSFYESVFSDTTQVVRYHERTAEALRDAVVKVRRKMGMTLERWVNYVHHGA